MSEVIKYQIVESETSGDLAMAVNAEIAAGWRPQGGVAVSSHAWHNEREGFWDTSYTWAQAMTKVQVRL